MSGLWISRTSPRPSVRSSRASESFLMRSSSSTVSFAIGSFVAGYAQDAAVPETRQGAGHGNGNGRFTVETQRNGESGSGARHLGQVRLRQLRRAVPGEALGEPVRAVAQ